MARYGLNGIVFTLLGPALFWLLFPAGILPAWATAELSCHVLRYLSFRYFVFPRHHGYNVSPLRYISATAPTSLLGLSVVALMKPVLGRNALVALSAAATMTAGYLINHFCYQRPDKTIATRTSSLKPLPPGPKTPASVDRRPPQP